MEVAALVLDCGITLFLFGVAAYLISGHSQVALEEPSLSDDIDKRNHEECARRAKRRLGDEVPGDAEGRARSAAGAQEERSGRVGGRACGHCNTHKLRGGFRELEGRAARD